MPLPGTAVVSDTLATVLPSPSSVPSIPPVVYPSILPAVSLPVPLSFLVAAAAAVIATLQLPRLQRPRPFARPAFLLQTSALLLTRRRLPGRHLELLAEDVAHPVRARPSLGRGRSSVPPGVAAPRAVGGGVVRDPGTLHLDQVLLALQARVARGPSRRQGPRLRRGEVERVEGQGRGGVAAVGTGVVQGAAGARSDLRHLCPGAYFRPLWRKLISFLISSWYFSTFVFAFLNCPAWRGRPRPRAGGGAGAGAGARTAAERETGRGIVIVPYL